MDKTVLVVGVGADLDYAPLIAPDGYEVKTYDASLSPGAGFDMDLGCRWTVFIESPELDPATYSAAVVESMTGGYALEDKRIVFTRSPGQQFLRQDESPCFVRLLETLRAQGTFGLAPEQVVSTLPGLGDVSGLIEAQDGHATGAVAQVTVKKELPDHLQGTIASLEASVEEVGRQRVSDVASPFFESPFKVAVFLSSSSKDPKVLDAAYTLGRSIVALDGSVVFGASYAGPMGRLADGAHDAGGHVTGVTMPRFAVELIPGMSEHHSLKGYEAPSEQALESGADRLSRLRVTHSTEDRVDSMVAPSDAIVIMPGGIGTFEEWAYVMRKFKTDPETMNGKQVFVLNEDGFWDQGINIMRGAGFCEDQDFRVAASVEELHDQLRELRIRQHGKSFGLVRRLPPLPKSERSLS